MRSLLSVRSDLAKAEPASDALRSPPPHPHPHHPSSPVQLCSVFVCLRYSIIPFQRHDSISSDAGFSGDLVTHDEIKTRNIPFDSVIKVFVATSKPNYMMPWQMHRQEACTGSAFVIKKVDGKRVMLTNAHVVRDAATVRVRRHGGSEKFAAVVLTVNDTCDLALITVEDDAFWEGLPCLSISNSLPELYETTMVIGYPMGGDNICVTKGVVSRVTTLTYEDAKFFLPTRELIAIQLDAAINSGNSGGPALDEGGKIVGVAFCGYAGSADNIGYIIPYPVISNFLELFARTGASTQICDLGFGYMLCENPSLRSKHKLKHPNSGILVTKVAPLAAAAKAGMKESDILTSIGGSRIGNDGTIDFRGGERLSFKHNIGNHRIGAKLELKILRDGKPITLTAEGSESPQLITRHQEPGTVPSYLIVGGIVFTPLTCGLLDVAVDVLSEEAWQKGRGAIQKEGEEIILILSILAHPLMHGYDISRLPLLVEFNGEKILNMKDLKTKVTAVKDGFMCFKLADGKSIILDSKQTKSAEAEILDKYQIPSAYSKNLADSAADSVAKSSGGGATKPKAKAKVKSAATGKEASAKVSTVKATGGGKKRAASASSSQAGKKRK